MAKAALAAALLVACAAGECTEPFCTTVHRPCATKQVSTCSAWPHRCWKILHGPSVYCSEHHLCLCGEGTCADENGRCVEPPTVDCQTKVSTCEVWPHHCSKILHGESVACSDKTDCLCGAGTCDLEGDKICQPITPFGPAPEPAVQLAGNATLRATRLQASAESRPSQLAALLVPVGLIAAAVSAIYGAVAWRRRRCVQETPFVLG